MKRKYVSVFLIILAALGVVIIGNTYKFAGTPTSAANNETAANIPSQTATTGPIRNLRFTLFDAGIQPNEMRIKAGLVGVSIEDRTYVAEEVTVQRVSGSERVAVGEIRKAVNQSRGRNLFRLTPGEYELFEPNRPENKALLIVEP